MSATGKTNVLAETPACLARSVLEVLQQDRSLEAVTFDRKKHQVAVATLGRTDIEALTRRLNERFEQASNAERCGLLAGGKDCASCDTPLSGAELATLNISRADDKLTIARVTCPTAPKFWRWRELPLPRVVQRDVEFLEHAEEEDHADEWKAQLALAVLCGVFGVLAGFVVSDSWRVPMFVLSYVAGAWFPAEEVWERLQKRAIDVHFLMLAVAAGAASIGAWAEGAVLLFLFSLSGALEHFALGRTQKEIRSLFRAAPKIALVLDAQNVEREIPVAQLRAGVRLRVKPGDQFPVDGEILKGATATDESNLTGEAAPVEKAVGDTVLAGTINLWGAVEVSVLRPASESALQRIIRLIREAQHQKAPAQRFTDKFGTAYTYFILTASLCMFFVWWLGFGLPPFASSPEMHSAFYRTMTLLVVASPCALVLSIPSAVLAAIAWGARHGILLRGGAAVEKLAEVNTVALDKTGTLTTGELRVEKVESFPAGREQEVARIAYSMERLSTHPLARAITRHGKQQGIEPFELHKFESVTGLGLQAQYDGQVWILGRREWVFSERRSPGQLGVEKSLTPALSPLDGERESGPGTSEIWISAGELLGRIVLRDDIRPQARDVVEELRRSGLRTVVLTGDRSAAAEHLRSELRVDEIRAELKPEQKVRAIQSFDTEGRRVAMVGDGVNDAPSLAAAHVGVAMGARGSDAALEQADVVLMHDRLENFLAAFRLSQRARRIIRQNLFVSLGTVVVLVVFALIGKMPLPIGVVGHEGSTVVVVMNSLRLLLGRTKQERE